MVTTDPEEASAAVARGEGVVLIVRPGGSVVAENPGRLAIMVGDPDDAETRIAATAMERELFAATSRP